MPFLGSLFNCSSNDSSNKEDLKISIVRELEECRVERHFMKSQMVELGLKIDETSKKALTIFGVEKDIAVMNANINYIKGELNDFKDDLKVIKDILMNIKK